MINPAIFAAMSAQVTLTATDGARNKYIVSLSKTGDASAHLSIAEIDGPGVPPVVNAFDLSNIDIEGNVFNCTGPQILFDEPEIQMVLGNVTMTISITHVLFNPDRQIFLSVSAVDMTNFKNWIGASGFPTGG